MSLFSTHDGIRGVAWAGIIVALALAGAYSRLYARLPVPNPEIYASQSAETLEWLAAPGNENWLFDGSVFKQRASEQNPTDVGPLAKRFRLAGTFFAIGNSQQSRKAIVDDLQRKEQQLVAEGDLLDQSVSVVSIFSERIIVRAGGHDEELRLSFSDNRPHPGGATNHNGYITAGASAMLNRFGKRVGETRWVLKREELMKYYSELLNNTERLAKVFDSLKPVYKANKIAGYTLVVEGEGEMFSAFGLKQNDVIRSVNKVPMISQSRAEYFIREFVNSRVNGFVLGIEREGKPEQLIYLVR